MSFWEIILIAVALAMDCFTVSVVSGVLRKESRWGNVLRMAFLFGFFQALMPLVGWLAIHYFQASVEAYDHWIAFGLLAVIGIKMVRDSFAPEEASHLDPSRLRTQLLLAVATSIDALAAGVSFAFLNASLFAMVAFIGCVTFVISAAGVRLGGVFGSRFQAGAEIAGGAILILIGLKTLLEGLGILSL